MPLAKLRYQLLEMPVIGVGTFKVGTIFCDNNR